MVGAQSESAIILATKVLEIVNVEVETSSKAFPIYEGTDPIHSKQGFSIASQPQCEISTCMDWNHPFSSRNGALYISSSL